MRAIFFFNTTIINCLLRILALRVLSNQVFSWSHGRGLIFLLLFLCANRQPNSRGVLRPSQCPRILFISAVGSDWWSSVNKVRKRASRSAFREEKVASRAQDQGLDWHLASATPFINTIPATFPEEKLFTRYPGGAMHAVLGNKYSILLVNNLINQGNKVDNPVQASKHKCTHHTHFFSLAVKHAAAFIVYTCWIHKHISPHTLCTQNTVPTQTVQVNHTSSKTQTFFLSCNRSGRLLRQMFRCLSDERGAGHHRFSYNKSWGHVVNGMEVMCFLWYCETTVYQCGVFFPFIAQKLFYYLPGTEIRFPDFTFLRQIEMYCTVRHSLTQKTC